MKATLLAIATSRSGTILFMKGGNRARSGRDHAWRRAGGTSGAPEATGAPVIGVVYSSGRLICVDLA
jgi:hypothetical protein